MTNPICWTCKNCSHECAADCEHFEGTAIYEAKIRLLEDISALGSCDELPYISKDKSTSGQPTNDIDDMYALLILATDHDLTDKLPRYVTDKPDLLPGVHLTDGDMRIFVGWLQNMDDRLSGIESTLADSDCHGGQR